MLMTATQGWLTGYGMLPQQYTMFKAVLSGLVAKQASILSFQDLFHTVAMLCFSGGLLALLIRRNAAGSSPKT
ncbi:hypothetical protein SDC9_196513 [bioreactor metagenome]|uniref:Uncharacterized protein n=1 Tax=bioreactor metagenome TaxID=1076179 RepID=A0A645IC21_9ZZZZ